MSNINNLLNPQQQGTFQGTLAEWFKGPNQYSSAGKQRAENVLSREHATAERLASQEFNQSEAQLNREFQERMSNTSYQRMIKDLQAAGINPALAINQGGSSTPSGSVAQSSAHPSGASKTAVDSPFRTLVPLMAMVLSGVTSGAKIAMAAQKPSMLSNIKYNMANAKIAKDPVFNAQLRETFGKVIAPTKAVKAAKGAKGVLTPYHFMT